MRRFRLLADESILKRFPGYAALVIYAEGFTNGPSDAVSDEYLRQAEELRRASFRAIKPSAHPHIQAWRAAYSSFGLKPSRFPCSVEALLNRIVKGFDVPRINRLVDFYNAVSLRYVIPVGGEDWSKLASDLRLMESSGTEPFVSAADTEDSTTYPKRGEIIWADSAGVTCRAWNWRQCLRTRLTESTSDGYFILDRLEPFPMSELEEAGNKLMEILRHEAKTSNTWSQVIRGTNL